MISFILGLLVILGILALIKYTSDWLLVGFSFFVIGLTLIASFFGVVVGSFAIVGAGLFGWIMSGYDRATKRTMPEPEDFKRDG